MSSRARLSQRLIILVSLALLGTGFVSTARADVIFSSFGPGNSYDTGSGWSISGSGSSFYQSIGASFTSSGDYTLVSIDTALSHTGGPNFVTLSLITDNGGLPTGTLLAQNSFTDALGPFGTNTILTWTPSTTVSLQSGVTYWVVADAGAINGGGVWGHNTQGFKGLAGNDGSGWYLETAPRAAAFAVNATSAVAAVPEPGEYTVMGMAGLTVCGLIVRAPSPCSIRLMSD